MKSILIRRGKSVDKENDITKAPVLNGAFIKAQKLEKSGIENIFWIKLSEIKRVMYLEDDLYCGFCTYKDCHYMAKIKKDELLKAINLFIFKPDLFYKTFYVEPS